MKRTLYGYFTSRNFSTSPLHRAFLCGRRAGVELEAVRSLSGPRGLEGGVKHARLYNP